jgi:dolichol kinase
MLAEYLEFRVANNTIDDNLIVPLVAGTTIYLLRLLI